MSEDQIIDPYTNIPLVEVTPAEAVTTQAGSANIPAVDEMTVGVGDEVFHANREGIWLGAKLFADALFSVTLAGVIRGIAGFIGGFEIGATYIRNVGNTFGLSSESTGADDIYFWAGTTYLDRANAEFWVTESGVVRAQSGTIGGWSLTATTFSSGGISLDSVAETITVGSGTPNLVIDGVNKRIRTSTYSTGLRGFSIEGSDGSAEFNNIRARGEFHSQVLSYGEVHVNAGSQIVSKSAAKLKTDFTSVTSPTTFNVDVDDPTTGHLQVFVVGDVLQVKDGSGNENWLTISSVSDQTTFFRYVCTKSNGSNATFRAGAAIADWGASGDGVVYTTADATNAPYISIQTHTGSPWTTIFERVRIGNLNGMLDFATDVFGIAIGSLTGGYMSYEPVTGLRVNGDLTSQKVFTTGIAIDAGSSAALESDGLLYRTRAKDFSTQNTALSFTTSGLGNPTGRTSRLLSVSSTRKALFFGDTYAANQFYLHQLIVDPTTSAVTAATTNPTRLDETTSAAVGSDAVMVTSTDAVVCWGSGAAVRARYVSTLDGTVSLGTSISVGAFGSRPSIVKVSATEVLVIYSNGNDIKATSVSISGTTLTAGSTYTILANGNTNAPKFAERFGTSTAYCVYFNDTTNTKTYVQAFTFSGTTMTAGTPLEITFNGGGSGLSNGYICNSTSSQMVVAAETTAGIGYVQVSTFNLSGTTLTLGATLAIDTLNPIPTNAKQVTVTKISAYTYALGYNTLNTATKSYLLRLTTDTLSILGSALAITGITDSTAITPLFIYHSPTRILMVSTSSASVNGFAKTVDYTTNFSGTVGVITSAAALSASALTVLNGENASVTGLTVGTEYYADLDGALTTAALGGTKRIGVAGTTSSKIIVQV